MITLTNPVAVTTTLGGPTKTNYDRLDIITVSMDVLNKNITGQCQLIASAVPGAQAIQGTYSIPTSGSAVLNVSVPNLPFFASLALTTAQQTAVQGWITTAQNNIEGGLVSVGVVAGLQTSGT